MINYLSIDVETTSLDPQTGVLLEVGAVYEDRSGRPIEDLPTYRAVIRHQKIYGEPVAIAMNAGLISQIAYNEFSPIGGENVHEAILRPGDLQESFFAWVNRTCGPDNVIIAGKNFWKLDYPFLLTEMTRVAFERRFSHRMIDPGMLYFNGEKPLSLVDCLKQIGRQPRQLHSAVGDARDVVEIIRAWESSRCPA